MMASEENEQPMLAHGGSPHAKYIVVFDPLGWLFEYRRQRQRGHDVFDPAPRRPSRLDSPVTADESCNAASKQVAAGYVVYGPSTMLVYSAGNGVHGFTLDPAVGAYVLSHPNIRIPSRASTIR